MLRNLFVFAVATFIAWVAPGQSAFSQPAERPPIRVLIVDGQNNHQWQQTTPLIEQTLIGSGLFEVSVATSPPRGEDMSGFQPRFADFDVVVSNYNGDAWAEPTRRALEKFVGSGGGLVAVHAADNSFPDWHEYNRMIGLGGWGGRDERAGPYVRWNDDLQRFTRDTRPGSGGTHGSRTPFVVVVRDSDHPITRGLPKAWMQTVDELYGKLRGPAENMHVLATAYSEPETGGTGEHEPILMSIHYGQGRAFHTTLGHDVAAMNGLAFQITLQRGTEWAATGDVTLPPVGPEILTMDVPATRDPAELIAAEDANDAAKDADDADSEEPAASSAAIDFDAIPIVDKDHWKALFNGQDLSGWTQKNGTATYRVEDGVIVGKTATGSPNSFLCTDEDFGDFELAFEVDCDRELNSGVQIRSRSIPEFNKGRVHGPQVEIEAAPGESGYLYSEGTGRGWLSPAHPIKDAYINGSWNRYLVRAVGPRIQTWINGQLIEDLEDEESFRTGFIGLQVHGIGKNEGPYQVRWRNIRIRPL